MIFNFREKKIFIYRDPVDMRKAHNGLTYLVTHSMDLDLLSGALFLFVAKNRKACKAIFWDGSGLVLIHKKLEKDRFTSFQRLKKIQVISIEDLHLIFSGQQFNIPIKSFQNH